MTRAHETERQIRDLWIRMTAEVSAAKTTSAGVGALALALLLDANMKRLLADAGLPKDDELRRILVGEPGDPWVESRRSEHLIVGVPQVIAFSDSVHRCIDWALSQHVTLGGLSLYARILIAVLEDGELRQQLESAGVDLQLIDERLGQVD